MAQRGGKREGAGRKPGQVPKAKRELADMAKEHADAALATLVEIATSKEAAEGARVSAAVAILDRGYGKPSQAVKLSGAGENGEHLLQVTADEAFARLASRLGGAAT